METVDFKRDEKGSFAPGSKGGPGRGHCKAKLTTELEPEIEAMERVMRGEKVRTYQQQRLDRWQRKNIEAFMRRYTVLKDRAGAVKEPEPESTAQGCAVEPEDEETKRLRKMLGEE